jgi:thioredoxin-dependent peroxiredoxin
MIKNLVAILVLIFSLSGCIKEEEMLETKKLAPDFELQDQDGKLHKLSNYRGKNVLIYFYPKDDTPGCTKEACALRDSYDDLLAQDLVIFGISGDSVNSHKKFADKYKLPFTLLADEGLKVAELYDAKAPMWANRVSYLISKDGEIKKVYPKVDPASHAEEILNDLRLL